MSKPTIPFSLRLTAEEHQLLKDAAGSTSMASFVRSRLFDEKAKPRKKRGLRPIKDREALARVLGQLGRSEISANLRSLSEAAQSGCLIVDASIVADLSEACADVAAMRQNIMQALGIKVEIVPLTLSEQFKHAAE